MAGTVNKFFDKKRESGVSVNEQLAEELRKPNIKKSETRKSVQDLKTIFGCRFSWNGIIAVKE